MTSQTSFPPAVSFGCGHQNLHFGRFVQLHNFIQPIDTQAIMAEEQMDLT